MEHSVGWWSAYGALKQIRCYPVNGNSDPDRLAEAIEHIYRIARATLEVMDDEK